MSLDLNKLENKLDEVLIKETTESLTKFLNDKRMKNNKQQTAVEGLIEQFWNNEGMLTSKQLEKALEIEKEQTEQAKLDAKEIIIIKHTEHGGGEE
jgi:hypothetical protein